MADHGFHFDLADLVPEREELDRYLEDTIVVDWQTPAVSEQARLLCEGKSDEQARVRALFEFVRDEIAHSDDIETDVLTCNASHVLRERTGLCYAKCHLLAALLRARGIPAGFCYQRIRDETASEGFVLHGLSAVYLSSLGEAGGWILLDPRGNNAQVQTEFRLDPPSLAFPIDPDAGEGIYVTLTNRPSKRVVDLLDYAQTLTQVRASLPASP